METINTEAHGALRGGLDQLLSSPEDLARLVKEDLIKVLIKFTGEKRIWTFGEPAQPVRLFVVDTETTGKEYGTDRIIEFGGVLALVDRATGKVFRIEETYNALQDPGLPIPQQATDVNGITDDMVKDQAIDKERVVSLLKKSDYVLAHNSAFDRPFLEDIIPEFRDKPWLCSVKQVDWASEGISSGKLDYIAMCLGFYYSAHRAEVDCIATIEALSMALPRSGRTGLAHLLDRGNQIEYDLFAQGSPFETKDDLKKRGYKWLDKSKEGGIKSWHLPVSEADLPVELDWLKENVYAGRSISLPVMKVTALERFSKREGQTDMIYA